jgi:capsular exopolysaccharide synthesis family protein
MGEVHLERMDHSGMSANAATTRGAAEDSGCVVREVTLDIAGVDRHLVAIVDSDPIAAERYNRLAVSFLAAAEERGCRRVLVVSAHHGEGRTTVAVNLAALLARSGRRVLLVDADLLRPSVLRLLGAAAEIGVTEAVARELSLESSVTRLAPPGFFVLPGRERRDDSLDVLGSAVFRALAEAAGARFDFVIFDTPPLLARPDAALLARHADGALLVIDHGRTRPESAARAVSFLRREDLLGVVLNRVGA